MKADIKPSAGTVREIWISQQKGAPMQSVAQVHALAGQGLMSDRNFGRGALQAITLIEAEKVQQFADTTGLAFAPEDSRRNIVTSGIELNPLVGQEFYIGSVRIKALELCEPCNGLAKRTHRAVLWGLLRKGGLRCEILTDGVIRVGDALSTSPDAKTVLT